MVTMLNTLTDLFATNFVYTGVKLLFSISIIFVFIGFVIKLVEMATTDMLTPESYIKECIHMVFAIVILYMLPTLIPGLVKLGTQFFVMVDNTVKTEEFESIISSDGPEITYLLNNSDLEATEEFTVSIDYKTSNELFKKGTYYCKLLLVTYSETDAEDV